MSAILYLTAFALTLDADLQHILDQARNVQQVPGLTAVVTYRDKVIFAGASGFADLGSGREMTPETVLYAGSLTKILTAVLALQLVEEGKLSLDDVVDGIAGEGPSSQADIRVSHLLTHSSGLEREGEFGYWFSADFPDPVALAMYLANAELRSRPGTSVRYSNVGYAALGKVIEDASGQAFGVALQTRVLEPMGMSASGAPGPASAVARGYTPVGRIIPSEERPFAGVGTEIAGRHVREYHDANAMTPAFGAYSTALDLGTLVRFLLGYGADAVLSDEMREQMLTSQASGRSFGLGVSRHNGRPVARHNGWFAAHRSHLLIDLQAEVGIVVIGNSDSTAPDEIAEAIIDSMMEPARRE